MKTSAEFRAFVRYFEERGLRATIADPRDLAFDGKVVRDAAGEPIDLIYRRAVSNEVFAAPAGVATWVGFAGRRMWVMGRSN